MSETADSQPGRPTPPRPPASGGGVLFAKYTTLRIPAGGLRIRVTQEGKFEADSVTPEVTLETWPHWLSIGLGHLKDARQAHTDLLAAHGAGDEDAKHDALEREFLSSMQAITSAAFAVDALYGSINDVVPPAPNAAKARSRGGAVMGAIHRVAKVSNLHAKALSGGLSQLFKFRNLAVHQPRDFRAPHLHPDLNVGVDWRFIAFNASNAQGALNIAMEALTRATEHPRQGTALQEWNKGQASILTRVLADHQVTLTPIDSVEPTDSATPADTTPTEPTDAQP